MEAEAALFETPGALMLFPGHDVGYWSAVEIELLRCEQTIDCQHGM